MKHNLCFLFPWVLLSASCSNNDLTTEKIQVLKSHLPIEEICKIIATEVLYGGKNPILKQVLHQKEFEDETENQQRLTFI